MAHLFFIDNNFYDFYLLERLKYGGHKCDWSQMIDDAVAQIRKYQETQQRPDIVFLDPVMSLECSQDSLCFLEESSRYLDSPRRAGLAFVKPIQDLGLDIPIFLYSYYDSNTIISARIIETAQSLGVKRSFTRPIRFEKMEEILNSIFPSNSVSNP